MKIGGKTNNCNTRKGAGAAKWQKLLTVSFLDECAHHRIRLVFECELSLFERLKPKAIHCFAPFLDIFDLVVKLIVLIKDFCKMRVCLP